MEKVVKFDSSRKSGIELLKIFAVFFIVVSHIIYTLFQPNDRFQTDYLLPLEYATTNPQHFLMIFMSWGGQLGNLIFFICSAWFLVDDDNVKFNKCVRLILDCQIISIIILAVFVFYKRLSVFELFINIFPTTSNLYWYIPFYVIFYCIHGMINQIVKKSTKKQLLLSILVLFILYFGINFLHSGHFFYSNLTTFLTVYLLVAYIKLYMHEFSNSVKKNMLLLGFALLLLMSMLFITNYLGLRYSFIENRVRMWGGNNSPILLAIAIAMFNIFKKFNFSNKIINTCSSVSILVFIIHENYLFRLYLRPYIFVWLYNNDLYSYILLWVILVSMIHFFIAMGLSLAYKFSLQKLINKLSDKVTLLISNKVDAILLFLMKVK